VRARVEIRSRTCIKLQLLRISHYPATTTSNSTNIRRIFGSFTYLFTYFFRVINMKINGSIPALNLTCFFTQSSQDAAAEAKRMAEKLKAQKADMSQGDNARRHAAYQSVKMTHDQQKVQDLLQPLLWQETACYGTLSPRTCRCPSFKPHS